MNNPYSLPMSLRVGGKDYEIRTDYRDILNILIAMSDPIFSSDGKETENYYKASILMQILYKDWKSIPPEHIAEACEKASEFIDCGMSDDGKPKPRLVDWEQDASIIIPAVNSVCATEVRAVPYMHWWTFFAYFMEVGESLFSSVISIRAKQANHKKLEKWEDEFYKKNKELIDFKKNDTEEIKAEKESILKWL